MNIISKRADLKWSLLIYLLIGLIVLGIIIYFIFNELFVQEDIDREVCRQSILLRANLPEQGTYVSVFSLKNQYPLKCKNDVIIIDYEDKEKVKKEIADALAACWFLFGNGELKIFPSAVWTMGDSSCVMCSRIHFSPRVREFYQKNPISMREVLNTPFRNHNSLISYFNSFNRHPFFNFEWSDSFQVVSGGTREGYLSQTASLKFPDKLNMNNGDLFILFNQLIETAEGFGGSPRKDINKLLFLQENSLSELDKSLQSGILTDFKLCKYWDGIPA